MADERINKIYKVAPDNFSIKMLYDMFIDFLQEGENGWELMRNSNWPYGAVLKVPNFKDGEYGYVGIMYGQIKGTGKKHSYSVNKNTSYGKWIQQADTLKKYVSWQVMELDSSKDWHYSQNSIQEYYNKPRTVSINRYNFNFGNAVFTLLKDVPIGAETITVTTTSSVTADVPRGVYITIGTDDDTSEEFLTGQKSSFYKIEVADKGVDTTKYLQEYSGTVVMGKCFISPNSGTVDNIYIGTTTLSTDISFSDALSAGYVRKLNIRQYNDDSSDYLFGDMFIMPDGKYAVYTSNEVLTDRLGVGTAQIIAKNPKSFFIYNALDDEMPTHAEYCIELKLNKPTKLEHLKGETVQIPTESRKKISLTNDNYEPVPSGHYFIQEAEAFYSDADVIWFNMFKQYVPEFDFNELMENTRQNPASKRIG